MANELVSKQSKSKNSLDKNIIDPCFVNVWNKENGKNSVAKSIAKGKKVKSIDFEID